MKDRIERHKAIMRHIKAVRISNQEDLLARVRDEGFDVTQATLSRDLKSLGVSKIYDGVSAYYYAIPSDEQVNESLKQYTQDLLRGWLSIQFSHNLAVVKTLAGHADSVAIALDNMNVKGLLGTVAGDDTILIVLKEGATKKDILDDLAQKVPAVAESL